MLLVDQHRRVHSVSSRNVRVPFVVERIGRDHAHSRAMFAECRTDAGFIRALREELLHRGVTVAPNLAYPDELIEAGMRAIASGMIEVARVLPDRVVVMFDEVTPSERYRTDSVVFAGPVTLQNVNSRVLSTPKNQEAFETALDHPLSRRYSESPPMQDAAGNFNGPVDRSAPLAHRVAWLLAARHLALVPRDPSRRRLRLIWVEHGWPSGGTTSPPVPPPPQAAPAPAPASTAPASILPDDPGDISPQAEALIDAAEQGIPFCEECARRAAELANA